jgi:histone-lysine N-methyltransferase SETMAR
MNSVHYSEMLIDRLKPAIQSKHQQLLLKSAVLFQDMSHPYTHTAAHSAESLQKLEFDLMTHFLYSPDLAPSDYHLFGPLKEALRSHQFSSGHDV